MANHFAYGCNPILEHDAIAPAPETLTSEGLTGLIGVPVELSDSQHE